MAVLDTLRVLVVGDYSDLARKTKTAKKEMTGFTKSVEKGASGALGKLTAMAAKAATGLAVLGAVRWGVKLAMEAETAQVAFQTMMGSADMAQKTLKELRTFASETPFQQAEIRNAGKQLIIAEVAADDLVDTLRRLGDISALTGNRIEELALLYSRAKNDQILMTEAINQFQDRGIPVYQEMAKQLGTNVQGVKKLASESKITFDILEDAINKLTDAGGRFAGGSAALSQTAAGKWSTVADKWADVWKQAGVELLPAINELLDKALLILNARQGNDKIFNEVGKVTGAIGGGSGVSVLQAVTGEVSDREIFNRFFNFGFAAQMGGAGTRGRDIPLSQFGERIETFTPMMSNQATVINRLLQIGQGFGQTTKNEEARDRANDRDSRHVRERFGEGASRILGRMFGDELRGIGIAGRAALTGGIRGGLEGAAELREMGNDRFGRNSAILKGSREAVALENRMRLQDVEKETLDVAKESKRILDSIDAGIAEIAKKGLGALGL